MAGQRIDDHSFWAGGRSKASVFPEGAKSKSVSNVEGAGTLDKYEDTEERIAASQNDMKKDIKKNPMKPGHRN